MAVNEKITYKILIWLKKFLLPGTHPRESKTYIQNSHSQARRKLKDRSSSFNTWHVKTSRSTLSTSDTSRCRFRSPQHHRWPLVSYSSISSAISSPSIEPSAPFDQLSSGVLQNFHSQMFTEALLIITPTKNLPRWSLAEQLNKMWHT